MELALADAGISTSDIGQINAHGTSTPLNDAAEAKAITKVFGAQGPPVVSTKGVTGHALGAAGAIEAAAVLLSFDRKLVPPTAGLTNLDPEITLDVVRDTPRPWEPKPVRPHPGLTEASGLKAERGTTRLAARRTRRSTWRMIHRAPNQAAMPTRTEPVVATAGPWWRRRNG